MVLICAGRGEHITRNQATMGNIYMFHKPYYQSSVRAVLRLGIKLDKTARPIAPTESAVMNIGGDCSILTPVWQNSWNVSSILFPCISIRQRAHSKRLERESGRA